MTIWSQYKLSAHDNEVYSLQASWWQNSARMQNQVHDHHLNKP